MKRSLLVRFLALESFIDVDFITVSFSFISVSLYFSHDKMMPLAKLLSHFSPFHGLLKADVLLLTVYWHIENNLFVGRASGLSPLFRHNNKQIYFLSNKGDLGYTDVKEHLIVTRCFYVHSCRYCFDFSCEYCES